MRGLQTWMFGAGALMVAGAVQAQDADAARQLLRQGQAQQAAAAYSVLIERSPGDPDHWLGRGLANARQALWPAAMADLEKAVALAPGYADAWSALLAPPAASAASRTAPPPRGRRPSGTGSPAGSA